MILRVFSGKKYRLADTVIGKSNANERVKEFRRRGDNVRLIKIGERAYQVWVRDIPSRRKALRY